MLAEEGSEIEIPFGFDKSILLGSKVGIEPWHRNKFRWNISSSLVRQVVL